MAKDVKRVVQQKAEGSAADHSVQTDISPAVDSPQPTQQAPVLLPSTVINLAVHSLLMLTVPFVLFFATSYGALDCKYHPAYQQCMDVSLESDTQGTSVAVGCSSVHCNRGTCPTATSKVLPGRWTSCARRELGA